MTVKLFSLVHMLCFHHQLTPQSQVNSIQYQNGSTFTAHALNNTLEVFKKSVYFADSRVAKVMVVLTDGQ